MDVVPRCSILLCVAGDVGVYVSAMSEMTGVDDVAAVGAMVGADVGAGVSAVCLRLEAACTARLIASIIRV